jgi:hypothetical protein
MSDIKPADDPREPKSDETESPEDTQFDPDKDTEGTLLPGAIPVDEPGPLF